MEKRYEKDPINGRWYEVREKGFTQKEWKEFQERWGQKPKVSVLDKVQFFMFMFVVLSFVTDFLGVW